MALKLSPETKEAPVRQEACALAALAHPNVVPVFDVGRVEGHFFYAMELIEGPNLARYARTADSSAVLQAFVEAGQGLAAAHARGIAHRAFSAQDVLLGRDGRARVANFCPPLTPFHPKLARADQFSYCAALWQTFEVNRSRLPRAVRRSLARGLSVDPKRRFPSMEALLESLTEGKFLPKPRAGLSVALRSLLYTSLW